MDLDTAPPSNRSVAKRQSFSLTNAKPTFCLDRKTPTGNRHYRFHRIFFICQKMILYSVKTFWFAPWSSSPKHLDVEDSLIFVRR